MAQASDFVRITPTAIQKGYVDVGAGLRRLLQETLDFNVREMELGSAREFNVEHDGAPLSLKINRPKAKMGAFQRLALPKSMVQLLSLRSGDELLFGSGLSGLTISIRRAPAAKTSVAVRSYPDRFPNWFGSQKGGVRLIFDPSSGRPSVEIETQLGQKLGQLAGSVLSQEQKPRLIMLAGGAGNGKTHAIEKFLLSLSTANPDGFKKEFLSRAKGSQVVSFYPSGKDVVFFPESVQSYGRITIIQDASEVGDGKQRPPEVLAIELKRVFEEQENAGLLLVCVNRGVLYHAATSLRASSNSPVPIDLIIEALDPVNVDLACWPLAARGDTYVWPLDIDSLAEKGDSGASVVEQILAGVSREDWSQIGGYAETHALKRTLKCLQDDKFRTAFSVALREYEIASGKNISFRKLYSIIGYLFSGGWTSIEGSSAPSAYASGLKVPPLKAERGNWDTCLGAYEHSLPCLLFPELPSTALLRQNLESIKAKEQHDVLEELCYGIERLTQINGRREGVPGAEHFVSRSSEWSINMDPARSTALPDELVELERDVALGIAHAVKKYSIFVDAASQGVLLWLAFCADQLAKLSEAEQLLTDSPKWATRWVTRLASIILKRAAAVSLMLEGRVFLGRSHAVRAYLGRHKLDQAASTGYVEMVCSFMLGEAGNAERQGDHVIELGKGLCQPFSPDKNSARVIVSHQPEGALLKQSHSRPASHLLVVELCDETARMRSRVPVTMGMDELISSVSGRLQLTGSLPAAIRGAVDTFRLQIDGMVLRDPTRRIHLQVAGIDIRSISRTNLVAKTSKRSG